MSDEVIIETSQELTIQEHLDTRFFEERFIESRGLNLKEETLSLNRVAKVVKGGRRFSFAALVAVGDSNGHVGLGFGKANEVPDAIQKARDRAGRSIIRVPLMGRTIPHTVIGRHDAARVLLKPASEGTGLIAGSAVRMYLGLAGIHDILAKSLGSENILNVIKATRQGLMSLRRADQIARLRGKEVEELIGKKVAGIYSDSKVHVLQAANPELARKLQIERATAAISAQDAKEARAAAASRTADLSDEIPSDDSSEYDEPSDDRN